MNKSVNMVARSGHKVPTSGKRSLDELDMQIIQCLNQDVRASNRAVAEQLGIAEGTVRLRIKRMQEQQLVRFTAIRKISSLPSSMAAYIGINVSGGMAKSVCDQLRMLPEVTFVSTMLGRYDILCCAMTSSLESLSTLLHDRIATIPGVKNTHSSPCIGHVKMDHRWGILASVGREIPADK